ncbi:kinase-like domain-containing protein [Pelagophyceae sp. CCMP2097]|nr:kinase-like domain-containing protein [Pelagophyceae sp. CCMP2097]
MEDKSDLKMAGFMFKKGGMRWQQRYFVLQQHGTRPARLAYYQDEASSTSESEARATLELTSDTKVDLLLGKPHAFQVVLQGRALKVATETAEEREAWMKSLRECIKHAISQTMVHFSGTDWFVDPKYKLLKKVGSGAYGLVVAADDVSCGKQVAIKKVANAFEDMVDAKRILREVRLMRQFNHPNVIKLYDIMEPPYIDDFEDLYIKILYSKTKLSEEQIQYLLYQLLAGMHYINSAHVLHRDLKPANLLIDIQTRGTAPKGQTCNLQICDFGLARGTTGNKDAIEDCKDGEQPCEGKGAEEQEYTEYRAPEIMLGHHSYDHAIDMWSIGCIFGEMLLQQPVFPGNDYIHQLKLIVKLLGRPEESELWFVTNHNAMNFMLDLPAYTPQDLSSKFPDASKYDGALDLLAKMLVFDPNRRIDTAAALEDKYVSEFRDEALEQVAGYHVKIDDVEAVKLEKKSLQRMLYNEIRAFHRSGPMQDHGHNELDFEVTSQERGRVKSAAGYDESTRQRPKAEEMKDQRGSTRRQKANDCVAMLQDHWGLYNALLKVDYTDQAKWDEQVALAYNELRGMVSDLQKHHDVNIRAVAPNDENWARFVESDDFVDILANGERDYTKSPYRR